MNCTIYPGECDYVYRRLETSDTHIALEISRGIWRKPPQPPKLMSQACDFALVFYLHFGVGNHQYPKLPCRETELQFLPSSSKVR
jgi:hypothetical protein